MHLVGYWKRKTLTGIRSWKKMNKLRDSRQILGERNRKDEHLNSSWSQKLRNVQRLQWLQRGSQLLMNSRSHSKQNEGKAISPCRKTTTTCPEQGHLSANKQSDCGQHRGPCRDHQPVTPLIHCGQPTTWIGNAMTTTEIDLSFQKDIEPVSFVDHGRPPDCNAMLPCLSALNQHHYVRQDAKRR